jgi:integrase/recombinase XerD
MATYKAVLKNQNRKDGTCLIMIRIIKDRKISHVGTGYYVKKKDWNPKGEVRATNDMHGVYNSGIRKLVRDLETIETNALLASDPLSGKGIKTRFKRKPGTETFKKLSAEYINARPAGERTKERYNTHIENFITVVGDLLPAEITKEVIQKYEKESTSGENTKHRGLKFLKAVYFDLQEKALAPAGKNPFEFATSKAKKAEKERLTPEEIIKLANSTGKDGLPAARDVFMLQYYLGGLRISDVLTLKGTNDKGDRLVFKDMKTGKNHSHIIVPKAREIIDRYKTNPDNYIMPFLSRSAEHPRFLNEIESATTLVNKKLKTLAERAEINKKVTSHIARHTFADHLRRRKTDLYTISKALGHSSVTMTENYLDSFDTDAVDKAMNDLFV